MAKFKVATEQDIDEMIARIIVREGGSRYTNNPKDAGGPTRFGVTAKKLGDFRRLGRDATAAEVKALTEAEAIEVYEKGIYRKRRIGLLPFDLQEPVMDACVTSGAHGIKILQRMLNKLLTRDGEPLLKVDGGLGPKTTDEIAFYYSINPRVFRNSYVLSRVGFFLYISNTTPDNRIFTKGWITKRCNVFLPPERQFDVARIKDIYPEWGGTI